MSPRAILLLLPLLCGAATREARHYSYKGANPAQWTSTVLSDNEQPATASDFAVSACNVTECTVGQMVNDANGNAYVVGSRTIRVQRESNADESSDVFILKLDAAGSTVFLATFSGKGSDSGSAIAVDSMGNILIGGSTSSSNFPLRNPIQSRLGRGNTGFLLKLNSDGSQLIFSTYIGGTAGRSWVYGVALDAVGNSYATGSTGSHDFTTTPGMPAGAVTGEGPGGAFGAFIVKLPPGGGSVQYSGIIAGHNLACNGGSSCLLQVRYTSGGSIAIDAASNAYVGGNTNVTDLPTTQGAIVPRGLGAWVARINTTGTNLDYLTYLGATTYGMYATAATFLGAIAVDVTGNAYIAGRTSDPKFLATTGAYQPVYRGPTDPSQSLELPPTDAFVAKLNPQATAFVYGTYLGGAGADGATCIAVDAAGSAYVTGTTQATDFPVTAGTSKGAEFLAVLNPVGSQLTFSTRLPAGGISGVAINGHNRVLTTSPTGVISSFALNAAPSTRLFGVRSAAGGQPGPAVSPGEVLSLFGTRLGPTDPMTGQPDNAGKMPSALGGTQVFFDGVAAPLLYVSEDQINAVAPFALSPGMTTKIRVVAGTAPNSEFQAFVIPARPMIFGQGQAAALNADGSLNSQSNPAKVGSVVAVWATGIGKLDSPQDGQVATAAQDYYCCSIYVREDWARLVYQGAAPGLVAGIVQLNFQLPQQMNHEAFPSPVRFPIALTVTPPGSNQTLASPYYASQIWVAP